ncbi:MAG: signal peptidase I [Bacilli bacterium]|nr:signal peptidase I [Bacilli bacterium]
MEKDKEIKKEESSKIVKFFKELVPYVAIIVVVLFIKSYIICPVQVNGSSMDSTLKSGDIMILNKLQYKRHGVERFDIVVIKSHGTKIIKRIIGLPGDSIEFIDNKLYINGKNYKEPYLDKGTATYDFNLDELLERNTVPENSYFVLGDNREESLDSRSIEVGFVHEDDIEGIAKLTIFPFNRIGNKN